MDPLVRPYLLPQHGNIVIRSNGRVQGIDVLPRSPSCVSSLAVVFDPLLVARDSFKAAQSSLEAITEEVGGCWMRHDGSGYIAPSECIGLDQLLLPTASFPGGGSENAYQACNSRMRRQRRWR
jgi:hypothetical protein